VTYDVHAHGVPEAVVTLIESEGPELGVVFDGDRRIVIADRVRTIPLRRDLVDMSARIEAMDRAGIDVQIISSWVNLTAHALDVERGVTWAGRVNDALAAEAARHADRLLAFGIAPLQAPEAAANELRRCVGDLGMVGVEIATTIDGRELIAFDLEPFWKTAAELRCIVMIHPMDPLPGVELGSYGLDNSVGRPTETTITTAKLVLSGVLDRHPDVRICLVHGGGFLPYQIGRIQHAWETRPDLVGKDTAVPPKEALGRLYFDTVLHDPAPLRYLIDLVGADHVVVGTDYPFEAGDLNPLATLDGVAGLTSDQRALITSGNVARLLGEMAPAFPGR
jgi:aminocarboxymuconate-semialdehyde decarboxylase